MKYSIRDFKKEDLPAVLELSKHHDFPFPDFHNMLNPIVIVDEKDRIVSFACYKLQLEALFIPGTDKKEIAVSLKMFLDKADEYAKSYRIYQIHIFTWLESFTEILKNRFNFRACKGTALIRDTE
jgi:hypothetical protein